MNMTSTSTDQVPVIRPNSFAIYAVKRRAFSEQHQYDEALIGKLQCVVGFLMIYVPQFLLASIGVDAPVLSLAFYKKLEDFRMIGMDVAEVALKKFCLRTWYLQSEVTLLDLFSQRISEDSRNEGFQKVFPLENPTSKKVGESLSNDTGLAALINIKSFKFSCILSNSWEELHNQHLRGATLPATERPWSLPRQQSDCAEKAIKMVLCPWFCEQVKTCSQKIISLMLFQVIDRDSISSPKNMTVKIKMRILFIC